MNNQKKKEDEYELEFIPVYLQEPEPTVEEKVAEFLKNYERKSNSPPILDDDHQHPLLSE